MGKLQFTPEEGGVIVCYNCDHLAKSKPAINTLTFPADVWATWQTATRVNPNLEILALFNVTDGRVVDFEIPPQEIEAAACTLGIVNGHKDGCIHSHHSMGANMSSMDRDTVLPNYQYSAVTNHQGAIEAFERVQLPCGGWGFKKLEVVYEEALEVAAVRERVLAVCKKPESRVVTSMVTYPGDRKDDRPFGVPSSQPYLTPWDDYEWAADYQPSNGNSLADNNFVAGCHTCEVYWDDDAPEHCWFCARQVTPCDVEMVIAKEWPAAEECVPAEESTTPTARERGWK